MTAPCCESWRGSDLFALSFLFQEVKMTSVRSPFPQLREESCFCLFCFFFFISELVELPLYFIYLCFCCWLSSSPLPLPPHSSLLTPTHLSSFTLITQLLLGNMVPAGPGISPVAPATEHMLQSR